MKILHYFLGFPPYRSGGLTKYCCDLMRGQIEQGNAVSALWPGMMIPGIKKVSIKKRKPINEIENYELINPLPVALDEGILDTSAYMRACDAECYRVFLDEVKPEVVHIHTLMGLHKEFVSVIQEKGIRSVFTTHDYYGLCPKVNLFRFGRSCEDDHECKDCLNCNLRALSIEKIILLQSPVYRILKNSWMVKQLRRQHRNRHVAQKEPDVVKDAECIGKAADYQKLRQYYIGMLEQIDCIHFNSTVTSDVYRRYMTPKESKVMTITHRDIKDRRESESIPSDILRIAYMSPTKPYKGFDVLTNALDELWREGRRKFELLVFFPVTQPSPYMKVREDGYKYHELEEIFAHVDVLAAPSIWYETFGFTALEALSFGVPVIVSDRVGAKDIVGKGGIIVKAGSVSELKSAVSSLMGTDRLQSLREEIGNQDGPKNWHEFLRDNERMYRGKNESNG